MIYWDDIEVGKAQTLETAGIIEYVPHSVVTRTILKNATVKIQLFSFDSGEFMAKKAIPFDTFIQIIDGKAEIVIDEISNLLISGQSIIIPAHASVVVRTSEPFKMISTVIKSGYE